MLEAVEQQAIRAALWQAMDVIRGSADVSELRNHLLAILVVKYVADRAVANPPDSAIVVANRGLTVYDAMALGPHAVDVAAEIDHSLLRLEQQHPSLAGAFQDIRFNSAAFGDTTQRRARLSHLLRCFAIPELDFRGPEAQAREKVAFACDALIQDLAAISGRRGFEFYTPLGISQLIARLTQPRAGERIGDPCCGSGSLLLTCGAMASPADQPACELFGQEKSGLTWAMAKINLFLHGQSSAHLALGDTLMDPKLTIGDKLQTFDVVVSCPPFGGKSWGQESAANDPYGRYQRGVPPRGAADYAFLSHMVATMAPDHGRMAAVVSLGVLFRGGAEQAIRERLLDDQLIDAVIALPPKLLPHTGLPVALLLLRQRKTDDQVFFIDASRDYEHGKTQNTLRDSDLARIEATYQARQDVDGYARRVSLDEIKEQGYNLSVARYVQASTELETVDLHALRAERTGLKAQLASLEARLDALLAEARHG